MILRAAALALLIAPPALAEPLALALPPGAAISAERSSPATSYALPTGPWQPIGLDAEPLEGSRQDTAWRLRANQQTTLQILAPLRDQVRAAGYLLLYECETEGCGGFDFRYALDLIPEPDMHVDLGDFRYLAARKGREWLGLTVSRSSESGFVHLTVVGAQDVVAPQPAQGLAPQPAPPQPAPESPLSTRLEAEGAVALDDLVFQSGASDLGGGDYASLSALADYLATRPETRIALVGHTDNAGSLAANVALSKARAEAVRRHLIAKLGVAPAQLSAEGAGWLAPRTTNLTPEGREKNRRVEAVLASTPR